MDTPNGQLTAYDVQSAARDVWHYVKNAFFDFLLLMNNARKKQRSVNRVREHGSITSLYLCHVGYTDHVLFKLT